MTSDQLPDPGLCIPVILGVAEGISDEELDALTNQLKSPGALSNTPVTFRPASAKELAGDARDSDLWCVLRTSVEENASPEPWPLQISMQDALGRSDGESLAASVIAFRKDASTTAHERTPVQILGVQLSCTENFNAFLASHKAPANPDEFQAPATAEPPAARRMRAIGAVADTLASSFQVRWQELAFGRTKWIARGPEQRSLARLLLWPGLFQFGLLAAFAFASYSELSAGCEPTDVFALTGCATGGWRQWAGPITFGVYFTALVVAYICFLWAKYRSWETQHQDYRLLAECLRVQYVWSAVGVSKHVAQVLPHALHTGSGWVRRALQSLTSGMQSGTDVKFAMKAFIEPQIKYHNETLIGRRKEAIERVARWASIGGWLFVISLIVMLINVALEGLTHNGLFEGFTHHVVGILTILPLAFWAGMRKIIELYAWELEAQRGEIVLDALEQAWHSLKEGNALDRAAQLAVLEEAGKAFVVDQARWHAVHRSRPIEPTTGA